VLSLRFFVKLTIFRCLYNNSAWNERISLPKLHPLRCFLTLAIVTGLDRSFTHRSFANCRQREFDSSSYTYVATRTRCRQREFDSMPYPSCSSSDRSQNLCVEKPSLNADKTLGEQSANAAVRELEYVCRG